MAGSGDPEMVRTPASSSPGAHGQGKDKRSQEARCGVLSVKVSATTKKKDEWSECYGRLEAPSSWWIPGAHLCREPDAICTVPWCMRRSHQAEGGRRVVKQGLGSPCRTSSRRRSCDWSAGCVGDKAGTLGFDPGIGAAFLLQLPGSPGAWSADLAVTAFKSTLCSQQVCGSL